MGRVEGNPGRKFMYHIVRQEFQPVCTACRIIAVLLVGLSHDRVSLTGNGLHTLHTPTGVCSLLGLLNETCGDPGEER